MTSAESVAKLLRESSQPLDAIDSRSVAALVDRIGDSRIVLLGESTHGSSEFYRLRSCISRALIEQKGFSFVAVEADWPDAARLDDYLRDHSPRSAIRHQPFTRFPSWMWRNQDVWDHVRWQRAHNEGRAGRNVGFHGLDLYSLFTSLAAVLAYLDRVDPDAAFRARERYSVLMPWRFDPAAYGRAVLYSRAESAESAVVTMLREMLERRVVYAHQDGERFFDAARNAAVVADAERYYRVMVYGGSASWNLRDQHMFDTLRSLLAFYGSESKAIVWEHNSHVGDARATEMSGRGELNLGQLCRAAFGEEVSIVGFGTDHGTVAAASHWDAPMQRMRVVPALDDSYEGLCHRTGVPAFVLQLREPPRADVRGELLTPRLERAIGVVYRPHTERVSHYFDASLPLQFDEYLWLDETSAVTPLAQDAWPA